jgi:DNA-binding transcriptional ArsR family regulator
MHPFEMFKVLGVESRIKILELLKTDGPLGAKKIAIKLGISTAAASQHLKILRQANLVKSERKGYYIPYTVDEENLEQCCGMLIKVCRCGTEVEYCFPESVSQGTDLDNLQKYKEELEAELKKVEDRISKLKK